MAYQESTPTSVSDMLNIISTFAVGLGWTEARNNTFVSGSTNRRVVSLSRSGFDHVHIFGNLSSSVYDQIHVLRSIGISTGIDAVAQPNRGIWSQTNLLSNGPFVKMYLFGESGSNPYVHCVVEHAAGRYRHFGFGELIKQGTWTGGGYCHGQLWYQQPNNTQPQTPNGSNHFVPFSMNPNVIGSTSIYNGGVRCDDCDATANSFSGVDDKFLPYNGAASRKVGCGFVISNASIDFPYVEGAMGVLVVGRSDYNQRTHLIRMSHFVSRASGYRSYIGEPPALRAIDMTAFTALEELVIGGDTWKIFPLVRKGDAGSAGSNNESSNNYALAYKKVA